MKSYSKCFGRILLPIVTLFILSQHAMAAAVELSLDDSIALALKNNPSIQIVEAGKEKSVWAVKQAQADKGFTVDYNHTDRRSTAPPTWVSSLSAVSPYNYFSNQLTVSLPIYTGGKLESSIDQAKLELNVSKLTISATRQQLKLSTTTGYFNVLQNRNLREIARQTVDDFSAHLKNVQAMYDAGTVALPDVLQTKVRLANAENSMVKAQNNYDLAVYSLNNTIGLPLRSEIKLKEELKYQQYNFNLDDIISYGLTHRPEMAQKQANIKIAQAQIKIAQSDKHPTVSLTGTNAWDDTDFAGTSNRNWTAILSAKFNVFDSGRTNSQIKQAQSSVTAAQEQARQNRDDISLEISSAYLSLKEAEKRINASSVAVEEADVNFKLAQERYSAGVGTNLDVMDAELALAQAKTNYVQALYDYNTSKAQLDKAMGIDVN